MLRAASRGGVSGSQAQGTAWRGGLRARSELRLKDLERMSNSVNDLRAREKRPLFTKDMKEELTMSEKILEFLQGGTDVRSAPRCLCSRLPVSARTRGARLCPAWGIKAC